MSKDSIREQFGAQAEAYVKSTVHAKGASLALLVKRLQPQSGWQVLDIATGAGHTALAFAPYVDHVTAIDITPQMLAQAQQLVQERAISNVAIETADAEALPYRENSFDLVTCRIAPHHFADIPLFIRESVRVLRPGGWLGIVDNVVPSGSTGAYVNAFEKLRDPSHGRCLSIDEWTNELRKVDLNLLQPETIVKALNFSFWAKRHDANMQSYLLALLKEASRETAEFLAPTFAGQETAFKLKEGLFIGQKPV